MLIILITLDCLRKDHFNMEHTPNFIRNIDDWVSFENGFSQSQNTLSSHFTMLTSNYLFQHGVYSNFKGKKLPGHSIDKQLRGAGFETKALCGVSFLSNLLGNQVGQADSYFDLSGIRIVNALKRRFRGERRPAGRVLDKGLEWILEKKDAANKFLWMHLFDAHMPYAAPGPYMKKYVRNKKCAESVKSQLDKSGWFSPYFKEYEMKTSLDYFPDAYKAAVRYIDDSLETFLGVLKRTGIYDESLIFVTSDHGECLKGDHDIYCAHKKLFSETINVPFFVKFPKGGFRGEKVFELVEHTDIAPTIAGYISGERHGYSGFDISELLAGRGKTRNSVFSEHVDNYMRSMRNSGGIYVEIVAGAENKWGMKVERESLFDRDGSPLHDESLARKLEKEMQDFLQENQAVSCDGEEASGKSREIEEQLRSLGYL
jgi:arylsulfatase A-like enzyme